LRFSSHRPADRIDTEETSMNALRLAATAVLPLLAAAVQAEPIAESFERMLDHPPSTAPVARPAEPADPLLHALVLPLRNGRVPAPPAPALAAADDQVAASFERVLRHPATATHPAPPEGIDPLASALVRPLRDAGMLMPSPWAVHASAR
jgi:hypothetical protein